MISAVVYGCDAHKRYSVFVSVNGRGRRSESTRVEHDRPALRSLPSKSSIAVETIGSWYWLIDEMEAAGHHPLLTHARRAKLLMGLSNKTDKLDVGGLATLWHNGTLPQVWIAPG
jgi:hypothetical protein